MSTCIQKLDLHLDKYAIDADKLYSLFLQFILFSTATLLSIPLFAADSQVEQGFKWMLDRNVGNCVTCHQINTVLLLNDRRLKEVQGDFAPSLQGVGSKYTRFQLLQWVRDARKIQPNTLMPPYGTLEGTNMPNLNESMLNEEQIQSIVSALESLR